jgi:threonine/homoserine/homoserine lactone efflux protein
VTLPELLLALIPIAIAAALQPPQVIALMVLLQTRRSLANGLAYAGGMTAFRLTMGALFWVVVSSVEQAVESGGGQFDLVVGAVLTVLGLVLAVYALRRGFSARGEDDAAASWLQKLQSVSPWQAALVGIAFLALDPKDWLMDLSAVDLVAAADLSGLASLLAYLWFVLMAQSLVIIPLLFVLVTPQKGQESLASLTAWLERHARAIEITVAALLSIFFLYAGFERVGMFS